MVVYTLDCLLLPGPCCCRSFTKLFHSRSQSTLLSPSLAFAATALRVGGLHVTLPRWMKPKAVRLSEPQVHVRA